MTKIYLISVFFLTAAILNYAAVKTNTMGKKHDRLLVSKDAEKDSIPQKRKKDVIDKDIKRLMMDIPASFSSADSVRLIANWRLGISFYKSGCAGCHGVFGKGKDSIPNFSKEAMDDYKSAFLAGDKQNHAVMSRMTENELNAVFLFITNIKRE